jgi:shikimate dehydrogenase
VGKDSIELLTTIKKMYIPPRVFASFSYPNRSIAPLIYNYAFKAIGFNAIYVSFESKQPSDIVTAIRTLNISGASISMPNKQSVLGLLDQCDKNTLNIGAANVVLNNEGFLTGYNTDWIGAISALSRSTALANKRVAIIGAGGAARAIAYGLLKSGCILSIFNRDITRAQQVVDQIGLKHAGSLDDSALRNEYDIIINTVPNGLSSGLEKSYYAQLNLNINTIVLEAVISVIDTPFLTLAKTAGCTFKIFTSQDIDELLLREALSEFLDSSTQFG